MKIFLIRHGETTGDLEDRYGGNYDDHLSDRGRQQLEVTALNLLDKGIEVMFVGPLIRTRESAEIINNRLNVPLEITDGLQERGYGILAGLTKQEALEKYPEAVEAHKDPMNTDPEGESCDDFKNRVINTFKNIISKDYKTIAIVSHGGPIKRILNYLEKDLPDRIGDGEILEINHPV